jgi:hypothetical protein
MSTYSIRIIDARTQKQLGACDDLESPHAAGRVACDAYTVLIGRDGHDPAHLALEGHAVEDGDVRPLTAAEEAAMVAALDQFMAEAKR